MSVRQAFTPQELAGWGRFPVQTCYVARPADRRVCTELVAAGSFRSYIARGLGRAYGDSALNEGQAVLELGQLDHYLAFDPSTGLLRCEAGVSIDCLINTLLPRGWFLPTVPGTRFVTLGGAIAADVHGKNHHQDGSFGHYVRELVLLNALGETVRCSRDEQADLFRATIGGMGLTGIILEATIQLQSTKTAWCDVHYTRTRDLDHTLDTFLRGDNQYRYSVAWLDCLSRGKQLGRSVVMQAHDATLEQLPPSRRARPLDVPRRQRLSVPVSLPRFVLGPWSVKLLNSAYYWRHRDGQRLLDYDAFFFPLDAIHHWNRAYGRRGFVQYQVVFPSDSSRQGLIEVLERVSRARQGSFLAVLKSSGAASDGWLSFMLPGHTLALDLPNTGDDLRALVRQLDDVVLKHGGRVYLAKDALVTPDAFQSMYPAADRFRQLKAAIDPEVRFSSSQARRLGLVNYQ